MTVFWDKVVCVPAEKMRVLEITGTQNCQDWHVLYKCKLLIQLHGNPVEDKDQT